MIAECVDDFGKARGRCFDLDANIGVKVVIGVV
jgi:hypothetical protein